MGAFGGKVKAGEGGPVGGPVPGKGGSSLGNFGRNLTPPPSPASSLALHRICPSNFAGTAPLRGLAQDIGSMQINPLTLMGMAATFYCALDRMQASRSAYSSARYDWSAWAGLLRSRSYSGKGR